MEQKPKQENKFLKWIKTSITVRMITVGILTLVLLIPLSYIQSLIHERQSRQEEVVAEINDKWGNEVLVYGPILKVPYKTYTEVTKENPTTKTIYKERTAYTNYAYFFPKTYHASSLLNPEIKHYGIYNSVVYKGNLSGKGSFDIADFSSEGIKESDIMWDKAKIIIKTSNLKGISNKVKIKLGSNEYSFVPKYNGETKYYYDDQVQMHSLESKLLLATDVPDTNSINFNFNMEFNGSKQIRIIPIGEETTLNIKSKWASPSFVGNYLPYNADKQTTESFDAKWKVLNINRAFSQTFFNQLPNLNEFAFGVNLMLPIDEYQQSTRSAKYGFLVISLTFLVFFLFQTISKVHIHPFQYLMIGIALTMFYTLLISISEHSNFSFAYLIAGASVVTLITLYSKSILKTYKFALFIFASLTALYTFIYVIIQMENYALVTGSVGLFVILALVMYASRKIDWNFGVGNSD